mmetsp:Transcript_60206/g.159086  ORF Transcript_60206/g.159086 Transcript_60206/m.159086 type:complete len:278 (+) Transcript_60206:201-1034(+)
MSGRRQPAWAMAPDTRQPGRAAQTITHQTRNERQPAARRRPLQPSPDRVCRRERGLAADGLHLVASSACPGVSHRAVRPLSPFQKLLASTGFLPGSVSVVTSSTLPSPHTRSSALPPALKATSCVGSAADAPTAVVISFALTGDASPSCSMHEQPGPTGAVKPRTRLCATSAPTSLRSSAASAWLSLGAALALSSSCSHCASPLVPSQTDGSASSSCSVPVSKSSSSSSGACSSPLSGRSTCRRIGPESILSTVNATLTPVVASPISRQRCTGAAPR